MLSRSFPRFLHQAGLLIAAAAISAVVHLSPLAIVLVMAGGFVIVVLTEWFVTREVVERPAKPTASEAGDADLRPMPRRRPAEPARPKTAPRLRPPGLDARVVGRDVARDEELSFLLLYLREFADLGGDLSEEFDGFVRESFSDLIAL